MFNLTEFSAVSLATVSMGWLATPLAASESSSLLDSAQQARSHSILMAQANNCRQVLPNITALNVRQAPSLTADVVGVVPGGRDVTLESLGADGWAPIAAPYEGYVAANYLTQCDSSNEVAATIVDPEGEQCRQVVVSSGLNVRVEPNRYSERLTALPTGTNVEIAESAAAPWVRITAPVDGYVAERFLGQC